MRGDYLTRGALLLVGGVLAGCASPTSPTQSDPMPVQWLTVPVVGRVLSQGAPVPDATVRILTGFDAAMTATTDAQGTYTFPQVRPHPGLRFVATATEYFDREVTADIEKTGEQRVDFMLEQARWRIRGSGPSGPHQKPVEAVLLRVTASVVQDGVFTAWCAPPHEPHGHRRWIDVRMGAHYDQPSTYSAIVTAPPCVSVLVSGSATWSITAEGVDD